MFRILLILSRIQEHSVSIDKLLIWDFYVTFPEKASKITFPREYSKYRRIFKQQTINPYDEVIDDEKVFIRMRPYQQSALNNLVSYGLLDKNLYDDGLVALVPNTIPVEILKEFESIPVGVKNVIKLVESPFSQLPLYGMNGFKYRTHLIDYKYDL